MNRQFEISVNTKMVQSQVSSRQIYAMFKVNRVKLAVCMLAIFVLLLINSWSTSEENFDQPFKYNLISFGAYLSGYFGGFLERLGLIHRVNVTRSLYHLTMGIFNIRDSADNITVVDELIDNNIPIRVYRPMSQTALKVKKAGFYPTILFFHGGGYFVGSADTLESVSYLTAKHTNYTLIYVEYRLIPEHKYPAALTDSLAATKYLIANYDKYAIDLENLILMGDSAGGNLASVISQTLVRERIAKPKMQVLIYPILQFFNFALPSYQKNLGKCVLGNIDHANFKNFIHYFTGIEVDDSIFENSHTTSAHKESELSEYVSTDLLPKHFMEHSTYRIASHEHQNDTLGKFERLTEILLHKSVSPLLSNDAELIELTPEYNFLLTAEIDILRDDGFIYASRLRKLGIHIEHKHYENLFHGVFGLLHGPLKFDVATDLVETVAKTIKSTIRI